MTIYFLSTFTQTLAHTFSMESVTALKANAGHVAHACHMAETAHVVLCSAPKWLLFRLVDFASNHVLGLHHALISSFIDARLHCAREALLLTGNAFASVTAR